MYAYFNYFLPLDKSVVKALLAKKKMCRTDKCSLINDQQRLIFCCVSLYKFKYTTTLLLMT